LANDEFLGAAERIILGQNTTDLQQAELLRPKILAVCEEVAKGMMTAKFAQKELAMFRQHSADGEFDLAVSAVRQTLTATNPEAAQILEDAIGKMGQTLRAVPSAPA
jgi:hypothetical protein